MFWSLNKFEFEADVEVYPIRDLFKESQLLDGDWESMSRIRDFLRSVPDLQEVVEENVGQILQVARLRLRADVIPSDGRSS